uniref:DUF5808 domain-containing protein n=1 Tax=Oscillatoriales cyanobacterium SpSt-402 TaxID=2282168 RepID=A0A832H316_9CYAN
MNKVELRRLWEDEQHWGHGSLGGYFCKQDPRLFVPKRRLFGGTLNLAHALAIPILTGIIVMLVLLVMLVAFSCPVL